MPLVIEGGNPKMQAIVLAGGSGRHLYAHGADVPKPMLPLFDVPVLEHTIRHLARSGIEEVVIVAAENAKAIIEYFGTTGPSGAKIRYLLESEPMGTAGSVKCLQNVIRGTFLVLAGDLITDFDVASAMDMHRHAGAVATILTHEVDEPTEYGILSFDTSGRVMRFVEKPLHSNIFSNAASTGIYLCEPEVLSCIPYNRHFDFALDLFPRMISNQEPVYAFQIPGYWCDVGNLAQYRSAHFDAMSGKLRLDLPAAHIGEGVWLGEGTVIDPTADLHGPLYLGSHTIIRNGSALGPRTVIGAHCLVDEGARVERSIVGGESFVGAGAEIRDSILGGPQRVPEREELSYCVMISAATPRLTPPAAPVVRMPDAKPAVVEEEDYSRRRAA
jgi:mannose-1-phosphate guanylyltransferase/phosphomannomutase